MPLPNDERLIALSEEILKQFEAMFGPHPGFRPVHAKGILLRGTFTPSSAAASLTRAQHAVQASTPVTVRFSDSTGVPLIPDTIRMRIRGAWRFGSTLQSMCTRTSW